MTAFITAHIWCDGGKRCPSPTRHSSMDMSPDADAVADKRSGLAARGWVERDGLDYCPACAKRLPTADLFTTESTP